MNELQKFIAELQGHWNDKEIKEFVIQWKIDNQWEQNKPQPMGPQEAPKPEKLTLEDTYTEEEVFEKVKTEGDAAGAGVELEQTSALVDLTDLTLENGSSDLKPIKLQSPTENYSVDGKKVTAEEFNSYTDFYEEFNKNLNPQGALLSTVKDRSMINVTQNGKKRLIQLNK